MQADEKAIVDYLKAFPNTFVSGRELARKVCGKRRYSEDRNWAIPSLRRLVQDGILETDPSGHYRIKQTGSKKKHARQHVSPQILRILKSSGKNFETIVIEEDEEEAARAIKPLSQQQPEGGAANPDASSKPGTSKP